MGIRNAQDIFDEFHACERSWMKIWVPNKKDFEHLLKKSVNLEEETLVLENRRPDCRNFLGKSAQYESQFSKYYNAIKAKLQENDLALHQLDGLLFAKEGIDNLKATIKTLTKIRNENWNSLTNQSIEYTAGILSNLTNLKNDVENINLELLVALEKVRDGLDKNHSRLKELLEPTHEWLNLGEKKRCTRCLEEAEMPSEKSRTIYDEPEKEYPHYW